MASSPNDQSSYEIKPSNIEYGSQIGKGAFGTVFQIKLKTKDGLTVKAAAKRIERSTQSDVELKYMSELRHKNIIRYYGFIREETAMTVVTELATKGDLQQYLRTSEGPLSEELMKRWATEAAEGIRYLHQKDIVHKDIKSSNYLISEENILKLGDFGTVGDLDKTGVTQHRQGTVRWMAPEVIENKIRSKRSDVFSYGIVTWEICTKEVPFAKLETRMEIMEAIVAGKRPAMPASCPVVLRKVIESCWQQDYQTRPNMEEVLEMLNSERVETCGEPEQDAASAQDEEEPPDRYEFFANMLGDMQKTTRMVQERKIKDPDLRHKFRVASKTARDSQIKRAEDSRTSFEATLKLAKPEDRLKLLSKKHEEMIAAKKKLREEIRNTKVNMEQKDEDTFSQFEGHRYVIEGFAKQTTEQMFQSCKDSEEWDIDDLNTFTRLMTMHAKLPDVANLSGEVKTYDGSQPTSDVLSLSCIPARGTLLEWKTELEARKTPTGFQCIEADGERYDLDTIQQMLTLHTALDTRSEVKQEMAWFLSPPVTQAAALVVSQPAGALSTFQDMVFHKRRELVQEGFGMTAVELSKICCDRVLSGKHIQWILTRLNEMQSDVFCLYPRAEEDTQRNLCKLLEDDSEKPMALLFIFNVRRSDKEVYIEDDDHPGSHYTLCYVNVLTNKVMYSDSLGWPVPKDLQDTISFYYQCIYGYLPDIEVFLSHESRVTEQGIHTCSQQCATYYPLQTCSSMCGVVTIIMASVACLHPNLFKFLTTVQRNTSYPAVTILKNPTAYSKYLRSAVATCFGENQIDIDFIFPKNFNKYLLVSTFDPATVVEMDISWFTQLIVPVPGLADLLYPDIPDSSQEREAISDPQSPSTSLLSGCVSVPWKGTGLDEIIQNEVASCSRVATTRLLLPNVCSPPDMSESRIVKSTESRSITNLFKLPEIPDRSTLHRWQQQQAETSEKLEDQTEGVFAYVEADGARYDAGTISAALDLHKIRQIKRNVEEELEWFTGYHLIPLAATKIPRAQSLKSFRNLIHTSRHDLFLDDYNMDAEELSKICCDRRLSDKHIEWVLKRLNSMQSDVRCIYHGSEESTLSSETAVESQTRPSFIVVIFNISKSGKVIAGDEDQIGCHHTLCYIDVSSGKVLYGDSHGLPAPDNLQDVIATYYQHLIGSSSTSIEVVMCHDVTFNTADDKHVCSPLCATYFPIQMTHQSISGVVCTLLAAIACLAPSFLKFLTSTQYNPIYTGSLGLHMHYPALHSEFLRRVLATWFVDKQIDIAHIVPEGFERYDELVVSGPLSSTSYSVSHQEVQK